ncbi:MAG: iron complex transport system ATP-binding protein, partial [Planctomycetota bacterium]
LCGLDKPASGMITINGKPLTSLSHKQRARMIAVVPQSLDSLPVVRVDDFVLGGRYAYLSAWGGPSGEDRAAVAEALRACDCTGLEGRLLTQLSGGQRQRVLIARALAQGAPVLLVDEPTNSLDPGHQLAIFELLAQLAKKGHAVLVVTHELNLASQFATSLMLLDEGRITCQGSAHEVLTPSSLEPIYGRGLTYGTLELEADGKQRPFVLPWRSPDKDDDALPEQHGHDAMF